MNLKIDMTFLAGAALIAAMSVTLGACGKQGVLEQPAPLFGERAKADYAAKREAVDAAATQRQSNSPTAAADQPDPNADNVPITKRDLEAPEEKNVPLRQEPIPGEPDLVGPPPSLTPPNGA